MSDGRALPVSDKATRTTSQCPGCANQVALRIQRHRCLAVPRSQQPTAPRCQSRRGGPADWCVYKVFAGQHLYRGQQLVDQERSVRAGAVPSHATLRDRLEQAHYVIASYQFPVCPRPQSASSSLHHPQMLEHLFY